MIKLFADGANLHDMFASYNTGVIQGFTTNPTLMRKAGVDNYEQFAKRVLKLITDVPVSFEVITDDLEEMVQQGKVISSWGSNAWVKIPIVNTKGEYTIPVIKTLLASDVKVNVTAILDPLQVNYLNSWIVEKKPMIVSIFAGRIADLGIDPTKTVKFAVRLFKRKPNVEVLWASTREVYNIIQAEACKCHIITVTPDILSKVPLLRAGRHPWEYSLDTVKMFYNDAMKSGYKL